MKSLTRQNTVIIRLSNDERKWLEERARTLNVSMSEVIRNNVFKDLFVYETTGLDDKSLGFIGRLSRIRGKDLTSTLNFLIHSCEKGYEKKFAAAQANFAPNAS